MTRIRLYEHPFAPVAPRTFEVSSLGEWLLEHYGPVPKMRLQIYAGEPSGQTEITDDVEAILRSDAPEYVVLQSPGLEPFSWGAFFANLAIAVAASVVMSLLFPPPRQPANVNRTQQSPNNALSGRENQVRLMQRVEDIYGVVRSVPSLMMPTYTKYHNHIEYEYGYYCVSRGYCDVTEIKDGETYLEDITGASAAVYYPFSSPNLGTPVVQIGDPIIDYIVSVRRANEVDGITLKAENQVNLPDSGKYDFSRENGRNRITQKKKNPNFNAVASVGDTLTLSMTPVTVAIVASDSNWIHAVAGSNSFRVDVGSGFWDVVAVGSQITVSGFGIPGNNGTFTVTARSNFSITVSGATLTDETSTVATFTTTSGNYSGTYTVWGVGDGFVELTSGNWPATVRDATASVELPANTHIPDWVIVPDADRTEIWVNVVAPQGMYKDGGGRSEASVNYRFEIERLTAALNPTGQVEVVTGTISGVVSDERAVTVEHVTAWTGPCRVRGWRTSAYDYDFNGVVIDEIKWADLYAVTPVGAQHFGNKTTIHTVTKATARATALKSRQLNCIAYRLLPTYNGSSWSGALGPDGHLISGTLNRTEWMMDILVAVALDPKIGQCTIDDLDIQQMWNVQAEIFNWSDQAPRFNYTFDSDTLSFEETATIICNAAFCIPYRQNGKIRLAFDKKQTMPTALFTHRNKKPNAESITRKFAADSEYDGVEFIYQDRVSNQPETIILPRDGSWTKLKKFEIPGITSFIQAWYRANREYYKLLGQRMSIESTVTTDARMLLPNTRVEIVDNTRFKSFDGEVIGQSGLELTLSRDVEFAPDQPHSIILMRRDGTLQVIACSPGSAANRVVLHNAPDEAVVTEEGQDGIRTIFSFAVDSARGAQAWSVQEIGASDGQYITIKAINYSDSYYQMDTQPVPDRASVIN